MVEYSAKSSSSSPESKQAVKHTPGPWKVDAVFPKAGMSFEPSVSISAHNPEFGKRIRLADIPDVADANSEEMANARLIAAAPELLEMLKEALELIQEDIDQREGRDNFGMSCGNCDGAIPVEHSFGCRAKQAIAKATGGAQ